MNGALLLVLAAVVFLGGYFIYSKWLARFLGVDEKRPTPAITKEDGVDYVPAHPTVLFGHHFAAIAGAGPIVGPVLAAEFGWLSVTLWIVLGCVFIGAMHDMISMYLSVRHEGKSIGSVIGEILGRPGKIMFLLFCWSALVLVVAEFNRQIAGTFVADPAIATASLLFIVEAVVFGLCVYRFKMSVLLASLIFVPLMFAFVWIGNVFPMPQLSSTVWILILLVYCFFASTCPVQYLLQPRDYLNAYLLYAMMGLGFVGIFVAHPNLSIDAFTGLSAIGRTGKSDLLFPMLFVTVACGACSGFHALVASGTSSKQVASEKSIRPIAYGGMLLEGVLAMIALIGVAGYYSSHADFVFALQTKEPVQLFASTIGSFCVKLGLPLRIAESFILLSVSAFLMTSVDAGTRLARFCYQELVPKKSPAHNMYFGTFIVCALAAGLLLGNPTAAKQLWTLFASANQLLASLTLLTASLYLLREKKPCWVTAIPMALMFGISTHALTLIVRGAFAGGEWIRFGASVFLLLLAFALIVITIKKGRQCITSSPRS